MNSKSDANQNHQSTRRSFLQQSMSAAAATVWIADEATSGPSNLRSSVSGDGCHLKWDASGESNYRFSIYRSPNPRRGYKRIATDVASNKFLDETIDTFGVDFAPDRWEEDGVMKHPDTWCGGIYGIRAANVNMCLPPLAWQTFDIEFTAACFEGEKKVTDARMTVHQNGVKIHDNVAIPEGTGGGPKGPRPEVPSGPIYVQSHGNPNLFRNIWLLPR